MNNYATPNDSGIIGKSDSQSINNAVKEAVKTGVRRVLIPRINERTGKELWEVDEATSEKDGMSHIEKNNPIRLHNLRG